MDNKENSNTEARLKAARSFFGRVAQLSNHLDRYLKGDEKELPIVKALHEDLHNYIQKCQLAMMRQGDMIGSEWNYEERVRLNQQEFEILKRLNNIYQKLKES